MYCGHACVSVCLSAAVRPHYCTDPDVTCGHGRGCPLVVHYWADLQYGHGLRCYGNITRTLVTSLRPSRDMTTYSERPAGRGLRALLSADWRLTGAFSKLRSVCGKWAWLARRWLAVDGGRSQHYCGGLDCGLPLATKSECKMLASTCLYSLYAWFVFAAVFCSYRLHQLNSSGVCCTAPL